MSSDGIDAGPYLGAMLRRAWEWVLDEMYSGVQLAGFEDLTAGHLSIFHYPSPHGMRPSDLASVLFISKQSVNHVLGYLERRGYLVRETDPEDARCRRIMLTAKGWALERTVKDEAKAAQDRIAATLGPQRFQQLNDALKEFIDDVDKASSRVRATRLPPADSACGSSPEGR